MPTFTKRAAIRDAIMSLNPRREDYMNLRRVMMNFILEEVAERHYKAFQLKKYGGRDEFRRRWHPLQPATIDKKGHALIGYETGHMEASFTPGYTTPDGFYIKGHQDQVARATAYSVKFGTKAVEVRKGRRRPKASYFHSGRAGQRARPFWGPRDSTRWVKAGIRKAMPVIRKMIRESA